MNQYVLEIFRQKWRLAGAVLLLILLNIVVGYVISSYQLPRITKLQTEWNELRRQASSNNQKDGAALYKQGSVDLEKLKTRMPEKREFARVLSDLLESAASCAVDLGNITYKADHIKEESLVSYQLAISVAGSYAEVKSFLSDLQNNQELIVVDSANFSNSDPYTERVVMNLNLSVYLREGA